MAPTLLAPDTITAWQALAATGDERIGPWIDRGRLLLRLRYVGRALVASPGTALRDLDKSGNRLLIAGNAQGCRDQAQRDGTFFG